MANIGGDPPASLVANAGPYGPALRAYLARTGQAFAAAQSPADAAAVVVATLTDPTPPVRVQTSDGARQFVGVKLADLDGSAVARMTGRLAGLNQWGLHDAGSAVPLGDGDNDHVSRRPLVLVAVGTPRRRRASATPGCGRRTTTPRTSGTSPT